MKKTLIIAFTLLSALTIKAQKDSIFKGYLYNDEYQVYIEMDFYHNNIKVPGQEIFGELPGYFGAMAFHKCRTERFYHGQTRCYQRLWQ